MFLYITQILNIISVGKYFRFFALLITTKGKSEHQNPECLSVPKVKHFPQTRAMSGSIAQC